VAVVLVLRLELVVLAVVVRVLLEPQLLQVERQIAVVVVADFILEQVALAVAALFM
jgi:hypothetical protein